MRHGYGDFFAIGFILVALLGLAYLAISPTAREVRLVGYCNGKLLAAMEEDNFPSKCDWIEVINLVE